MKTTVQILLFLTLLISGCDPREQLTPEQRQQLMEERTRAQMQRMEEMKTFMALCDHNNGVREFDADKHVPGSRYRHGAYIECNNGLNAWMNQ